VLLDTDFAGLGDGVKVGQGQRGEHRGIGRQHRGDRCRPRLLPGQRRMHVVAQFARPFTDTEKMQPDMGVLIHMLAPQPGVGTGNGDAQLFFQLANQRLMRCFPARLPPGNSQPGEGVGARWPSSCRRSTRSRRRRPG
jgi:hypothetical protein